MSSDSNNKEKNKILIVFMLNSLLIDRCFIKNPESLSHSLEPRYPIKEYKNLKPDFTISCHDIHSYRIFIRPYFYELINYLRDNNYSIAIWSDEMKRNIKPVLEYLFGHPQGIILTLSHTDIIKIKNKNVIDLKKLWGNKKIKNNGFNKCNTLFIVSDSKKNMILQKDNIITIPDYIAPIHKYEDKELLYLKNQLKIICDQLLNNNSK